MIPFLCLNLFLDNSDSETDDLQYVAVPLIDNAKCIKPHTFYDSNLVTSNMVCAGDPDAGSCFGDAGGSLVVADNSDADLAVLYGLVSWGANPCAQADGPGVFTRITPFVGFIRGQMKGMMIQV